MNESIHRNMASQPSDVDGLMTRVRERVAQRRGPTSPNGKSPDGALPQTDGEVARALAAQGDFNHSSVRVLATMGEELRRLNATVSRIQDDVGRATAGADTLGAVLRAHLDDLRRSVQARIEEIEARIQRDDQSMGRYLEQLQRSGEHQAAQIDGLSARIDGVDQAIGELREAVDGLNVLGRRLELRLSHELDHIKLRLVRAERQVRTLGEAMETQQREPAVEAEVSPPAQEDTANGVEETFDYLLFEHHFRGPIEDIKRRQQQYVPLFEGRQNVLDLGSGRGEFVGLLSEHGIGAQGIDINEDMVTFCRGRGIQVIHADLFAYLEGVADASVDGIACFQVVEHLQPEQILRLISLCGKKVQPAAPVVVETVNPICPLAMGNFYLDPSHIRPVPPQMLRFMFEQGPFVVETIRFSAPVPGSRRLGERLDVPGDLPPSDLPKAAGAYQDYAAIARRR
jgi:2-polyprenyl-3-methyl-5-hydroxy-6-metoxy-1,4-benzoquinol methylase